jgi:hypothetical protein
VKRTAFEIGGVRAASLALMGLANACHATHRDARGGGAPGCFDGVETCSESDIVPIPWGIPDAGAVAFAPTHGAEHGVTI